MPKIQYSNNLHTYIQVVYGLNVDLSTDTKKTCVYKKLDYILIIHSQFRLNSQLIWGDVIVKYERKTSA